MGKLCASTFEALVRLIGTSRTSAATIFIDILPIQA